MLEAQDLEETNRLVLLRRVYGVLSIQLLITMNFVAFTVLVEDLQDFLRTYFWVAVAAFGMAVICMILLACFKKLTRKTPFNYILLVAFTLSLAIMLSYVSAAADPITVLIATGLIAGVPVVLTVYLFITRNNFKILIGLAVVGVYTVIWSGILFGIFYDRKPYKIVSAMQVLCILVVLLFGVFLAIDTRAIANNGKWELDNDDYIVGSLILFVDFVVFFFLILSLMNRRNLGSIEAVSQLAMN